MKSIKILLFLLVSFFCFLSGQNYQELQKLQGEYKKALDRQALQKPKAISEAEKAAKSTVLPDKLVYSRKDIESLLTNTEKLLKKLKFLEDSTKKMPYIGYDLFVKRDSIPFWQNLPISMDYTLGSGDEIIIALWGESNSYTVKVINRDGQIFIDNIGTLNIAGKTLSEAKTYILSKYSRVYSTLLGSSPRSFIDLTLGELKSINVHFVGFVNIPGVHLVHPYSNVINGLTQAGGVDYKGTLRDIRVIRNKKTIGTVDVYNYIISGLSIADIRLMDQDIVFVPPRNSTIPLTGEILRPGYYEAVHNETLFDLISFSGGLHRLSSKKVFVFKNSISDKNGYIIDFDKTLNFAVAEGDSIFIPRKPSSSSFVNIQGQVKSPGNYPFNKALKLKNLINATMSLDFDDFSRTMDLKNIIIHRKNPLSKSPITLATNLDENILLKSGDHVVVPYNSFFQPLESIKITGEIAIPGSYPVNNLTTLSDILNLSGGYSSLALNKGIEIFRDSLKIAWEDESFLLKSGDSLNVLKKTGLILVKGEINVPGYVTFKKNYSLKEYLKKAGGLTAFADNKNIYITYPNGLSVPVGGWYSPKVKEGSIIFVNQRAISGTRNINGWEAFAIISSQAGSFATTLLSISLLLSQSQGNGN